MHPPALISSKWKEGKSGYMKRTNFSWRRRVCLSFGGRGVCKEDVYSIAVEKTTYPSKRKTVFLGWKEVVLIFASFSKGLHECSWIRGY